MESQIKEINPAENLRAISLWLDNYEDIFSDFDPRPFVERAISDDFLAESKKMFRENSKGKFELRFLVPQAVRNDKEEAVVSSRLKRYFKSLEQEEKKKIKEETRKGFLLSGLGFSLSFIVLLLYRVGLEELWSDFLLVFLEPGGWFMIWFGLDKLFYDVAELKKSHLFTHKMAEA
ncbi:MAG: hypothetical protein WEC39_00990, partial [Patescibacteria group bacterium]